MNELAINGGTPVRTKPWLDNFTTGEEEKRAVLEVLDGGYMSLFEGSHYPTPPFRADGGPWVRKFEALAAEMIPADHVVSVNSASSGLTAAAGAIGIGFGDEMIIPCSTMSACPMAAMIYGAVPVFADVDPDTMGISPASIRERITPRTKAIMVVHLFGIPCDMDEIMAIAREHDLKVIEDCAQAWGATYKGKPVGTFGDIGVFSFNVNKTIQSGEGGLCVTADADLAYRMQLIRNHAEAVADGARYDNLVNMVGFNFRMTELVAAVAYEQLKKLGALNERRMELVGRLSDGLAAFDCIEGPLQRNDRISTYYVYPFRFKSEKLNNTSVKDFVAAVNAEGMDFVSGYGRPLYLQSVYQTRTAFKHGYPWAAPENSDSKPDYSPGSCPNAERMSSHEIVINERVRPPHTDDDIDDMIKGIEKVVRAFGG